MGSPGGTAEERCRGVPAWRSSFVPAGLASSPGPAMNRWAIIGRPSGTKARPAHDSVGLGRPTAPHPHSTQNSKEPTAAASRRHGVKGLNTLSAQLHLHASGRNLAPAPSGCDALRSPSPPWNGGEGRGEAGRHIETTLPFVEAPLSPSLSPLVPRGARGTEARRGRCVKLRPAPVRRAEIKWRRMRKWIALG